jgi:hypothetical protein
VNHNILYGNKTFIEANVTLLEALRVESRASFTLSVLISWTLKNKRGGKRINRVVERNAFGRAQKAIRRGTNPGLRERSYIYKNHYRLIFDKQQRSFLREKGV